MAFEQLAKEFNMSHIEISDKVGLSRSAVANKIRLLNLPEEIRRGLLDGEINEGHARAILGLTSPAVMLQAFGKIVRDELSVRAVEELVRRLNQGHKKPSRKHERILDQKTLQIEMDLKQKISKRISLSRSKKGGKIIIPFRSDKELNDIYSKLSK
jgi:ParB family chromosome partitioning protein